MKRLLLTSALVLSTSAGAVLAQASDTEETPIRNSVGNYLATSSYDVDVDSLTDEQIAALYSIYTSEEDADVDQRVGAVLNDGNVEYETRPEFIVVEQVEQPRDQIYDAVTKGLTGTKFEGMAWELDDEELATAYAILQNENSNSSQDLEAVFN
ncbi:hypothetical protein [Pseudoruegeria sp. HB172150]|uniref:hypothetical protein n=1 Tax=Pseudoruegeria sp. HB172150 TaxID=2721164 RepID=UPI0015529CF0|nr:hypothetical protein [Pseudoruegeria sp. HB172150]